MTLYQPPLEDLSFLLHDVLRIEGLARHACFARVDGELIDAVLDGAGRFAVDVLAPINATGDEEGSRLVDGRVVTPTGFRAAYHRFIEGGWLAMDLPEEIGGQGLPVVLQTAVAEMCDGACVAFGMLPLMQRAGARLLMAHGSPALVDTFARPLAAGEWTATICISEPQAGSDVGRVRTKAEPHPDGGYLITGTKIFISFGDHDLTEQIIHLVLARVAGAAPGTKGLSLFVVPRLVVASDGTLGGANSVSVARVEKKMGLKASPTCVLDFEGAAGFLVGEEGGGMQAMFTMINTLRLGVAVQGVAVAGAATAAALAYAGERPQGGPPASDPVAIIEHADVRRMLLTMRARTEAMRALTLETALNIDLARAQNQTGEGADAQSLATWLLPVCKTRAAETGFEVANLGVQVLGGQGYIRDAGVEQYVRDSRVQSIYEGTSGIQALDLVTRKLRAGDGRLFELFSGRVRATLEAHGGDSGLAPLHDALSGALEVLERATADMGRYLGHSPRDAEAAATPYLQLVGLVAEGWMWLRMAAAAKDTTPFHAAKRATARFHAEHILVDAAAHAQRIGAGTAAIDALDSETLAI